MKCPNPDCAYSEHDKLEETANFCSKCGLDLRRREETSSSQSEKTALLSKNSTQVVVEVEDRHCSPLNSIGKSLYYNYVEKHLVDD